MSSLRNIPGFEKQLGNIADSVLNREECVDSPFHIEDLSRIRIPDDFEHKPALWQTMRAADAQVNPFAVVADDVERVRESIKTLLGTDHPVLQRVARYFFEWEGKMFRPSTVLLMSRAVNATSGSGEPVLNVKQRRLAEISEMIHTASLLHDDVIDVAETRRGVRSINHIFGNKLAVLGGDFLLARTSVSIARLRNLEVIEVMSTVIEHLVKGEIMQMLSRDQDRFDVYTRKTFYKTASLLANSCKSAALLGDGIDRSVVDIAYAYGLHTGMAFQLVDDVLDYTGDGAVMGKETGADLKQGVITAPVLFASQEFPELEELIERRFDSSGDVERAQHLVQLSRGVQRTKELAEAHSQSAVEVLGGLPDTEYRRALIALSDKLLHRLN